MVVMRLKHTSGYNNLVCNSARTCVEVIYAENETKPDIPIPFRGLTTEFHCLAVLSLVAANLESWTIFVSCCLRLH